MRYPLPTDRSTPRSSAEWEALAQRNFKLKLTEGLLWSTKRERRQVLLQRLRRHRSISRQWMLFGDFKMPLSGRLVML